ncbi:IS1096 element passenger TnpR family protein [Acidithiobacillus acidisediminis]|uniref:IS1096 element passenger TnpR family protein n=1 Tax=Acidithiobacillus acidisediminis TaxID=2937799 RepID=UPI003D6756A8
MDPDLPASEVLAPLTLAITTEPPARVWELQAASGSAYVAAGAGACPYENSGGIPDYQQFLDACRENPKSKEAREFLR